MRSRSDFEVVPIGYDCSISHFARAADIRRNAYPFDWNVTPLISAVSLIENRFEGFLEEKNLEFLPPTQRILFDEDGIALKISNEMITPVVCKKYNMLFPHDFSKKGKLELSSVREKYRRRIARLYEMINSHKKIFFVYSTARLNDWQIEQYEMAGLEFNYADREAPEELGVRLKAVVSGAGIYSLCELQEMITQPHWGSRLVSRIKKFVRR